MNTYDKISEIADEMIGDIIDRWIDEGVDLEGDYDLEGMAKPIAEKYLWRAISKVLDTDV